MDMTEILEPSDTERAELPETTACYLEALEEQNEKLKLRVFLLKLTALRLMGANNYEKMSEKEAIRILNRTPAQSLASIKAQTLREAAKRIMPGPCNPIDDPHPGWIAACEIAHDMLEQADRIEQEAE